MSPSELILFDSVPIYIYTVIRNLMSSRAYIRIFLQMMAFAAILVSSPTLYAAATLEALPSFDATYAVRYGFLRGTMTLKLSRDDHGYIYETSLSPRGVVSWIRSGAITESTSLEVSGQSVRPLDYISTDTIARPARNTRYFFAKDTGQVTGEYKAQTIDVPMRDGGHNRISAQVAIMFALKSGTAISRVPIFDRGRWKDYEFEIVSEQMVETPSGRFSAVEIRYASNDKEKSWSLFCSESLDYMPVLIVYRERGKIKSRAELTDYRNDDINQ